MDFSLILCGEKNFYRTAIVYNEETDSITHHEFIGADKLDSKTKSVLSKATEGIVVLQ